MNAKDHIRITRHALRHYQNHLSADFKTILATGSNESELVQGTDDEDNFSFQRATNWHFYRREDDNDYLQPFKGFFDVTYDPSSRSILTQHNTKFTDLIQKHRDGMVEDYEDFFNHLGRLIHHIQDMSTPSHVVPVFHGPEFFKDFHWRKDNYEKFSKKNLHKYLNTEKPEEALLPAVSYPGHSDSGFIGFYDRSANNTLDFLKSDEAKFDMTMGTTRVPTSCDVFWRPYDSETDPNRRKQNRGFGQYGPFEEFFSTGKTLTIDGLECTIEFASYEHVFIKFVENAIADTLYCLMYADQCLTGKNPLVKIQADTL